MIAQLNIDDIGSLLPYGILLLVYFLLSFHSELQKNRFFAVPVLGVLLFFVGLRGAMTPDMQRYREMYENSKTMEFNSIEPSFLLISRFLNAMRLDYHALFFTYSFITLFFLQAVSLICLLRCERYARSLLPSMRQVYRTGRT